MKNEFLSLNTSSQNFNTSFTGQMSPRAKSKHNELLNVTSSKQPQNYLKSSNSKIMREVHYLNKDLNRSGKITNLNNYKNRPMVNLKRPEFDLNVRSYTALSPKFERKNYLVTGNVLKNYKEKKSYNFMNHNNYLVASKQSDHHSAEQFLRGKIYFI